ncbi:PocR ligand-binding domain-containing protein [Bengtsoniella intestinalis]|uniref:PocR ligand-binding domain-containing protein n=1 Tax=Bengtsoniella intestinalis TaxID=3073143 RepID=UPI00391EE552
MLNFDRKKLLEVLKAFYAATGARVAIYNLDHCEIASYPPVFGSLCDFLRQEPVIDAMCQRCDEAGFAQCQKTKTQYLYYCHMGLCEAVAPIMLNNRLEGYIMMGQVLPSKEEVLRHAGQYLLDTAAVQALLEPMDTMTLESLEGIGFLMNICVEYLGMRNVIITATSRAEKFDEYIRNHLAEPLSPQEIANHFFVSRTTLHTIIKEAYGMSLTQRINFLRIEQAKVLLLEGKSVEAVWSEVGFHDRNYFYKNFKRYSQMTVKVFLFQHQRNG